ncbi:MAG TPA: pitrilysin family protein [Vicinamibacterales bacterium]|nr:pitrilysin family protein [Vicinamibacterales bacterium]
MRRWVALAVLLLISATPSAQQNLDRKKIPTPGKTPELRVPAWTKSTLVNGAELLVSEKHDLPLISFSLTFLGGADQFEPAGKQSVASLTAALLSEGTKTRDAEALSNALQLLGTSVNASVSGESGSISFRSTTAKFPATLDILADILVNPTFPENGLERLRGQRLVQLTQARAQPGAIANRVFPRIVYGSEHPYGRVVTEESLKAVTRADLVAFHKAYYQPGRALITVVGDTTAATVKPVIEKSLAAWTKGGERPSFTFPPVSAPKATTIFLVDKPGAAQSTFAIGRPGPPRNTPDFYALQVMNTMLGGMFQSRLNANIREEKGYSYGVTSSFGYGKGPGPFRTGGDIVTEKSDAALVEFMKELKGIIGGRPITDEELTTAKDALIQRLPGTFASVSSINSALTTLWVQNLPDDYYQQYAKRVAAITRDDVLRVAKQYVTVDNLAIVIVGDRKVIEGPLKATNIAPIVYYDIEGNRLAEK